MTAEKQLLSLYVHTHWDREWYWAFERYRTVLISAIKLAVQAVESGEVPSFHLDGQVCALEDFLELEPSFEDRIKKLNAQNKLSIGPWYVLADQMLVSGESLIRNLELGLKVSRRFGKPMMVGYSPDTFGHSQDLPRILSGFGIDNAVVWRGVPELDQGPEFFWCSPDGSEVLAIALTKGYYQTMFHDAEGLLSDERIGAIAESLLPWVNLKQDKENDRVVDAQERSTVFSRYTNGCLVPVGGDHLKPPARLSEIVELVGKRFSDIYKCEDKTGISSVELQVVQLSDYIAMVSDAVRKPAIPVRRIEGELRENSTAKLHCAGYMLPGVLSTRLYLKRENRILEHRLSRISEPVYSLMAALKVAQYPAVELENAWKYLLKNHPHDSMCGCSVDDVHREMMTRFGSIHQVLDILDQRVKQELLVPGVHEWSDETTAKSRRQKPSKIENAGFGRGNGELADPDVPLTKLAVCNLSTESVSAPVNVCFAIPAGSFDSEADPHPPDSTSLPKSSSSSSGSSSSSSSPFSSSGTLIRSDEELRLAASRYLTKVVSTGPGEFQIESVGYDTELFGELGGVPLYKDVYFVNGWIWAKDNAPLGVTKLSLDGGIGSADSDKNKRVNGSDSEAPPAVHVSDSTLANEFFDLTVGADGSIVIDVNLTGVDGWRKTGRVKNVGRENVVRANADAVVDEKTERFSIKHRFQDVADAGDSYNFDPILNDRNIRSKFKSCRAALAGPLVGSLILTYTVDLPKQLVEDFAGADWGTVDDITNLVRFVRSEETIEHEIQTTITLKRGSPLVLFDTVWNNQVGDHRLEVVFDTESAVKRTWSENHFSLVERNLSVAETELPVGRYDEMPLDRFPSQRFFVANGQAFYNLGLPEYGVDGTEVSMTVLRAISMLSRKRLLTRGGGAGPYMPVPEANGIGENKVSYAWAPLAVLAGGAKFGSSSLSNDERALAYKLAEQFEGVLWSTPLTSEADEVLNSGSLVTVSNAMLRSVAFYSNDGGKTFLLRLLNVSLEAQEAILSLRGDGTVDKVNLDGNVLTSLQKESGDSLSNFKLPCGANELVTLRIAF